MRSIRCEEILKRSDFQGITDKDFEEQVSRYCIEKMNEYEFAPVKLDNLKEYPEKKYEIFKLNFDSGVRKIFILDTNLINYYDDINEKELYYSRIIAKRICENMKRLTEDAIVGIHELEQMHKDEIDSINEKIKELKELDEDEYNLDRFVYNSLKDTSIIEEVDSLKNKDEDILNENKILKEKLKASEDTILELSNKLKISLEDIQKNREKLQLNTTSKFEKIINNIKNFFE